MRSEPLGVFLTQTSDLNRGLTQALFVNEQFLLDHADELSENPSALTSDHFTNNPYRRQFNWALGKLDEERASLESFLFKSTYAFIYSAFEVFTEKLYVFVKYVQGGDRQEGHESWIEACFESLGTDTKTAIPQEALLTLDYLRWRRNRLVHNDGTPSQQLAALIRSQGHRLDKFWEEVLDRAQGINFTSTATERFTQDDVIDLIRIFRRLADMVDGAVLGRLGVPALLAYMDAEFSAHYGTKLNGWERPRRERKFGGYVARRLGFEPAAQEVSGLKLMGV